MCVFFVFLCVCLCLCLCIFFVCVFVFMVLSCHGGCSYVVVMFMLAICVPIYVQ